MNLALAILHSDRIYLEKTPPILISLDTDKDGDQDQDGFICSSDLYLLNYLMDLDIKDTDIRDTMKLYNDKLDLSNLLQILTQGLL